MSTITRTPVRIITTAVLTAGLVAAGTAGAEAKGKRGEVRVSGSCTGSTDWKLKAKLDDRRIEVEFEVDANRAGQTWQVLIADNDVTVMSGTRRTKGPSGSFEVERHITNRAGADRITAVATRAATGETCSAVLVFTA